MRLGCVTLICIVLCIALLCGPLAFAAGDEVVVAATPSARLQSTENWNDEPAGAVARGVNDFAFRLSAELAGMAGDENFICSPYSVWIPLAALANATGNAHKADLLAAIGAAGMAEADINRAASRMLYDLTRQRDRALAREYGEEYYHDPLKIANAIFVDYKVTLRQDFAQMFADFYRGSAMGVDFSLPSAVDAVNRWASENTEGLIADLIQKFSPDTVLAIANAIYFSDRWSWQFAPEETATGAFRLPGGDETIDAFFMLREGEKLDYYEDDLVQAMPLNFLTGGAMYILLPKDMSATELLISMEHTYFEQIARGADERPGRLLLPRFSIEGEIIELKDALQMLGVPLFDDVTAPLTGRLIEEGYPMWVSSALHKAVIEVDEQGTTAAAVTVMMMEAGSAPPEEVEAPPPFEMICDKPFIFVLCGRTVDGGRQVLFTGVVNRPQE